MMVAVCTKLSLVWFRALLCYRAAGKQVPFLGPAVAIWGSEGL
jgi:hypothetical protein